MEMAQIELDRAARLGGGMGQGGSPEGGMMGVEGDLFNPAANGNPPATVSPAGQHAGGGDRLGLYGK